jgi:hypothetical protein
MATIEVCPRYSAPSDDLELLTLSPAPSRCLPMGYLPQAIFTVLRFAYAWFRPLGGLRLLAF